MSDQIEDRLSRALAARAAEVTPAVLRPAAPPQHQPHRRFALWAVPALAAAAAGLIAVLVVANGIADRTDTLPAPPAETVSAPSVVTGSACPREEELVTAAFDKGSVSGDVDGDGRADLVAVAADDGAPRDCRAFVGVRLASSSTTYSTALDASAVPPAGMTAEVIGLPDLGDDLGAEIVVDTHALADGTLAQLFTVTGSELVRWPAPAFEDGNFVVEGGGITSPSGAGCTADGSLVLSLAVASGQRYEVTRQVYPLTGDQLEASGPDMSSRTVPADQLTEQFPEFAAPHFGACGDVLGSGG